MCIRASFKGYHRSSVRTDSPNDSQPGAKHFQCVVELVTHLRTLIQADVDQVKTICDDSGADKLQLRSEIYLELEMGPQSKESFGFQ